MKSIAKIKQDFTSFNFDDREVRVIARNGDPWFLASDLCEVLGLDSTAVRRLDDDEKGLCLTQTPGGEQQVAIVSESGMWTMVLRCRDAIKPGTVPYRVRKWVTAEVLPSIRKTGTYAKPAKPSQPETPEVTAVITYYEHGMPVCNRPLLPNELVITAESYRQLAAYAGYVVMEYEKLLNMSVREIVGLCNSTRREHERWRKGLVRMGL